MTITMVVTQLRRRQTAVSIAEGDYRFIAAVSLKVAQVPPHLATGHRLTAHATPTCHWTGHVGSVHLESVY
jgi:hypothetical protein